MANLRAFWKVDLKLLPLKLHYFLFFAGLACALPFRTVYARQLGVSATAVGVIFLATPFLKIVTNPLFGFLLDYFKRFRLTTSVIMIIMALSHIAMGFIPPKESNNVGNCLLGKASYNCSSLLLSETPTSFNINVHSQVISRSYDQRLLCTFSCNVKTVLKNNIEEIRKRPLACEKFVNIEFNMRIKANTCDKEMSLEELAEMLGNSNKSSEIYATKRILFEDQRCKILEANIIKNATAESSMLVEKGQEIVVQFGSKNTSDFTVKSLGNNGPNFYTIQLTTNSNDSLINSLCASELECFITQFFFEPHEQSILQDDITDGWNEYLSVQFWGLFTLMSFSSVALTAAIFLMDTICYEILGTKKNKYGEQRLWGTIGWGLGALAGGYLNDIISGACGEIDYTAGFYLLAVVVFVDLVPVSLLKVEDVKFSPHICKDVCFLLSKPGMLLYIFIVYVIGVLSGLLWNYQFWFMEEIGASQTLLGLSQTFECLFAELPCFLVSGWIIRKLGHEHCNSITFLCFGLRYLCFAFMYDPWMSLPVALLQGPTFGLFFASMTMFGKTEAPPGTEATVQSLLCMAFEGVGAATGSILGGVGIDKFGSRLTFLYAGIISLGFFIANVFLYILIGKGSKTKEDSKDPSKNET